MTLYTHEKCIKINVPYSTCLSYLSSKPSSINKKCSDFNNLTLQKWKHLTISFFYTTHTTLKK